MLLDDITGESIIDAYGDLHSSGDIEMLAATIMPDHVHLLFALGSRLRLGQVMGKLKSTARRMGLAAWQWEQDGFEHRVRKVEDVEDYGFYIFMNPYRAGLCPLTERWHWWFCPDAERFRFFSGLNDRGGRIPSMWLGLSDQVSARICTKKTVRP